MGDLPKKKRKSGRVVMGDLPKWKKGKSFERDEGSKAHSEGGRVRKRIT